MYISYSEFGIIAPPRPAATSTSGSTHHSLLFTVSLSIVTVIIWQVYLLAESRPHKTQA
jgi:hypothetical protein